jgi:hypothetical protein
MGGNARLNNYATGILEPLYARAMWLSDHEHQWLLLSLDLLALWQKDADAVRRAVTAALETSFDSVTVACTHTHSGPDTMQSLCWNEDKLRRDEELLLPFRRALPEKCALAAKVARDSAQPVLLHFGKSENLEIARNRRLLLTNGRTAMNWELPPPHSVTRALGPVDPQVTVLDLQNDQGASIGGFVHFSCHPAILAGNNLLISGDFAGSAMSRLEHETGAAAYLFLNGAEGNVNHIDYMHAERARDEAEVSRCAESLYVSALEAIRNSEQLVESDAHLKIESRDIQIPIREIGEAEVASAQELLAKYDGRDLSLPDGVPPELNARRLLKLLQAKMNGEYPGNFARSGIEGVNIPMQTIRIGRQIIGAVPAEMFVEFGLEFKQRTNGGVIVGLANGLVGYIPTETAFAQGGYETGIGPSYLKRNAGNLIIETLIQMAEQ